MYIFKAAAKIIYEPLETLFNLSLALKYVPESWKRAVVVPIPKTKKPEVQDLGPVSLLSLRSRF